MFSALTNSFLFTLFLWTINFSVSLGSSRYDSIGNTSTCFINAQIQSSAFVKFSSDYGSTYDGYYFRRDDLGIVNCSLACNVDSPPPWWGTYIYENDNGIQMFEYPDPSTTYGGIYMVDTNNDGEYCDISSFIISGEFSVGSLDYSTWTRMSANDAITWTNAVSEDITVSTFCDAASGIPSSCNTDSPTLMPTPKPLAIPTSDPTAPSISPTNIPSVVPTPPTNAPTTAPSNAPTLRPTHLPTIDSPDFPAENCNALYVEYLSNAYDSIDSNPNFYIGDTLYNGRSQWVNNAGVKIYYTTRFSSHHWIISNSTYTLLREDPTNSSYPSGSSDGNGYAAFDHYPNDDIHAISSQQYTLRFTCSDTLFPTSLPSQVTTHAPSSSAPSQPPTASPTISCSGIIVALTDIDCEDSSLFTTNEVETILNLMNGRYQQQGTQYNSKYWYRGVDDGFGDNTIYFNDIYEKWVVDSEQEWSLIEETDVSEGTVLPPNATIFTLTKSTDYLFPECSVEFNYRCRSAFATNSPTTGEDTSSPTDRPSVEPSATPTNVPTKPPTTAPTQSPSPAPTAAPTSLCNSLYLYGAFNENGSYNLGNGTVNERAWWYNIYSDATLFYSSSVLHETWVVYSASLSEYYLSINTPPDQPATGEWDYYVGSSPFISDTVTLTIDCQANRLPTPLPTMSPSAIPTANPVTTLAPTLSPVKCDFVYVSINDTMLEAYEGIYSEDLESESGIGKLSWTNRDDPSIVIFYSDPFWYLGSNDITDNTSLVLDYDHYKPPDSALWQLNEQIEINGTNDTEIVGGYVYVDFDCAISIEPTTIPSYNPSTEPTGAPTSACQTLTISSSPSYEYDGSYTKQSFELNGHSYWKSNILDSEIAYDRGNGYWYVATTSSQVLLIENVDDINDNDDEYYPPSGTYIIKSTGEEITVTTECFATRLPTSLPSTNPTSLPTTNDVPYWTSCEDDDDTNFFDFVITGDDEVIAYWDIPTATEDRGGSVTVTNTQGYIPGNTTFSPGVYTIEYTATDNVGRTADTTCDITLFIVGNSATNSYDTCIDNSFTVSITVNESNYHIIDTSDSSVSEYLEFDGKVSNEELNEDSQNCYVTLTAVTSLKAKNTNNSPSVTGELESFDYWELIIILLGLWLIIITAIVIKCICFRKQVVTIDSQKLLAQTAAEAGDASIYAGVADGRMMRKATLTGAAVVGGVGASPNQTPLQSSDPPPQAFANTKNQNVNYNNNNNNNNMNNNNNNNDDDMKMGDVELGAMTPGLMNQRPSEKLENEKLVVPTNPPFWQREMDYLGAKGYTDEKKSLQALIANAVKYAGKIDKGATATVVEKIFDNERNEQLKSNAAKNRVQKEWDNQEQDQLNAPQAAIAPPTMSSLVDSSNVLMEDDDDDDDILKQIGQMDTRKGSYDLPDPNQQGRPPAPVPPPMGNAQRPNRADIGNPRESTHLDL